MENGVSPEGLLPRRLGYSRGNRVGGLVVGMILVAEHKQVNRHFNSNSVTFGWSTAPVNPMAAEIVKTRHIQHHAMLGFPLVLKTRVHCFPEYLTTSPTRVRQQLWGPWTPPLVAGHPLGYVDLT